MFVVSIDTKLVAIKNCLYLCNIFRSIIFNVAENIAKQSLAVKP